MNMPEQKILTLCLLNHCPVYSAKDQNFNVPPMTAHVIGQ